MGDTDFPSVIPNTGFLQQYIRGMHGYSQKGTDVPDFQVERRFEKERGGPTMELDLLSRTPSFEMAPDIDSPAVDRWIQNIRNQPGYQKPKFLSPDEMRRRVFELDRRMRGLGA